MTPAERAALLADVAAVCVESMQQDATDGIVLRLADNSTVYVTLKKNGGRGLRLVTSDGQPIRHCKRGHILLAETTYLTQKRGMGCLICRRLKAKRKRERDGEKRKKKMRAYWHRTGQATIRRERRHGANR